MRTLPNLTTLAGSISIEHLNSTDLITNSSSSYKVNYGINKYHERVRHFGYFNNIQHAKLDNISITGQHVELETFNFTVCFMYVKLIIFGFSLILSLLLVLAKLCAAFNVPESTSVVENNRIFIGTDYVTEIVSHPTALIDTATVPDSQPWSTQAQGRESRRQSQSVPFAQPALSAMRMESTDAYTASSMTPSPIHADNAESESSSVQSVLTHPQPHQ